MNYVNIRKHGATIKIVKTLFCPEFR